jgi:hypothetical protein
MDPDPRSRHKLNADPTGSGYGSRSEIPTYGSSKELDNDNYNNNNNNNNTFISVHSTRLVH